jgi:hypothetical protein
MLFVIVEKLEPDERTGKTNAKSLANLVTVYDDLLVGANQSLLGYVRKLLSLDHSQNSFEFGGVHVATVALELSAESLGHRGCPHQSVRSIHSPPPAAVYRLTECN